MSFTVRTRRVFDAVPDGYATVDEIARSAGLAPSTTRTLVGRLVDDGWLASGPLGTFRRVEPVVRLFICPEHAPIGIDPEPNDDGRPSCCVCGRANYAVKPYTLRTRIVERGWVAEPGKPYVRPAEVVR